MRRALPFLLSIVLVTNSFGTTLLEDANGHASADFTSSKNVIAVVPKGTEVDVLEEKKLPSGNCGVKVKINQIGTAVPTRLKVGDEIWVYYHTDRAERVMELQDKNGKTLNDCVDATQGKAISSFKLVQTPPTQIAAAPPTKVTNTSEDCPDCVKRSLNPTTAPAVTQTVMQTQADLQHASDANVTEVVPSVDELVSYIQKIAGHTDAQLAQDKRIAQDVIADCSDDEPALLIPLVLSMMKEESDFKPGATSKKGAAGLMQLMPATAADLAGTKHKKTVDRYNIETSIKLGVKFIKQLMSKYHGDISQVLTAYNAGEGAEEKIEAGKKKMSTETKNYVAEVSQTLGQYASIESSTNLSLLASNP